MDVMIRPEQIRLQRSDETRPADRGVAATVVGHTFFGPDTVLQLELADGSGTLVTARTHDDVAGEPGAEVTLFVEGPVSVYRPLEVGAA